MREPTLVMAHQVEENPGHRVIHRPTRDWPRKRGGRGPTRRNAEGGDVFNGCDRRSTQIDGGNHFVNSKCTPKSSSPNWRFLLNRGDL